MNNIAYTIIVNAVGLIIITEIFLSYKAKVEVDSFEKKIFSALCIAMQIAIIFETLAYIIDGAHITNGEILNRVINCFVFALNLIPPFLWSTYAYYRITQNEKQTKKNIRYTIIPAVLVLIICIINLFIDLIFTIKPGNIYERTNLFFVPLALSYSYFIYVFILIFKYKNKLMKNDVNSMFLFMMPTLIGSFIQFIWYGIPLVWISASMSLFILYINIQNKQMLIDPLTGVYNRRPLDVLLDNEIGKKSKKLTGIMIDIDDFKGINDKYGHAVGDEALQKVSKIFFEAVASNGFVYRYGGDEFVIILRTNEEKKINNFLNIIKDEVEKVKNLNEKPYLLNLSYGYVIYDNKKHKDSADFIKEMDQNMYLMKKNFNK